MLIFRQLYEAVRGRDSGFETPRSLRLAPNPGGAIRSTWCRCQHQGRERVRSHIIRMDLVPHSRRHACGHRFFSSSVVFVKVEFVLHMRDAARRLLQQEAYPSIGMIKFLPAMTKTIQDFELRLSPQRPVTPNKFHGVQTHGYERIVITVYM